MNETAVQFLSHVFQSPPALLQTLTFSRGSEQAIHQDFPYVFHQSKLASLAAFWIPLEDIHPDSGPLEYFSGSHRMDRMGFFDWKDGAINQYDRFGNKAAFAQYEAFLERRTRELGLARETFLPRKGDLLVWHGALAHAGTRIIDRQRTRKSLVGHFTALNAHPEVAANLIGNGYAFGAARQALSSYQSLRKGLLARIASKVAWRM